jgi:hypothetical protein
MEKEIPQASRYAVIHAVAGLFEGYSDTTCEFFPKRSFADKHINQIISDYRKDEMCVCIEHQEDGVEVTMTREYKDYHACVPFDMEHDDWVAENGDDCSVEVFRIIEIDCERYENAPSTEHMWLTWNQIETTQAWDYTPLCMSLVARVSSDVMANTGKYTCYETNLEQLTDFISDVYYRNHAFIDVDDYTMHAFRIPKPKNDE